MLSTQIVIDNVTRADYKNLIEVWELSVRATHEFLTEEDILFYRDLILNKYFDLVHLNCVRDDSGHIYGFIGTAEKKIEMLFIHPGARGKGLGKKLLQHAVNMLGAEEVDVNEQNPQALGFYLAQGFRIERRSPLDGMGKSYPVLHLVIDRSKS